jgi:hypothetical protein
MQEIIEIMSAKTEVVKQTGFDLKKNNLTAFAEAGHEFQVTLPDDTKIPMWIKVRGEKSPQSVAFQKRYFNAQQQKETIAKRKKTEVTPTSIDELNEMLRDTAVVRTIGWRGVEEDNKPIPFNTENAARIYEEHEWLRDLVIAESNMVANFLGRDATTK